MFLKHKAVSPGGGCILEETVKELVKKYEALVIISCKNGGDAVSSIIEKLKKLIESNAMLESVDEWGKRKLAYDINKEKEAYYVLFTFESKSDFPAEFVRICRITDGAVRAMVTNCLVKKHKKGRNSKAEKGNDVSEGTPVDSVNKSDDEEVKSDETLNESDGQS